MTEGSGQQRRPDNKTCGPIVVVLSTNRVIAIDLDRVKELSQRCSTNCPPNRGPNSTVRHSCQSTIRILLRGAESPGPFLKKRRQGQKPPRLPMPHRVMPVPALGSRHVFQTGPGCLACSGGRGQSGFLVDRTDAIERHLCARSSTLVGPACRNVQRHGTRAFALATRAVSKGAARCRERREPHGDHSLWLDASRHLLAACSWAVLAACLTTCRTSDAHLRLLDRPVLKGHQLARQWVAAAALVEQQKDVEGRWGYCMICRGRHSARPVHPSVGRVLVRRAPQLDTLR